MEIHYPYYIESECFGNLSELETAVKQLRGDEEPDTELLEQLRKCFAVPNPWQDRGSSPALNKAFGYETAPAENSIPRDGVLRKSFGDDRRRERLASLAQWLATMLAKGHSLESVISFAAQTDSQVASDLREASLLL